MFTIIIRDVTESRRAQEAVRESEARFRLVANTAPVLIWMSGPDKLRNYFNQPWLEFTGRPIEAELGNGWTNGVHPEDFNSCLDTYIRAFVGVNHSRSNIDSGGMTENTAGSSILACRDSIRTAHSPGT